MEPVVRLGAADSTSGELSGLDGKPDQSRRWPACSTAAADMVIVEGAGDEIATMGAPFFIKEESEGEVARDVLAPELNLLAEPSGVVCVSV